MRTRLLLTLALVLCAFLRFYHLDGYGLWSDEFVTLLIVSAKSFGEVIQTCFEVPQPMPPLYFLANKWVYGFSTPGEIGLRVLSAAASLLAGFLLFAIGRLLVNEEVGLWGLFFFAVNSTQIVYAQNARPYALGLLLSAASTLSLLKWNNQSSLRWALGYVVSTAMLLHTHYVFFPLLLVHAFYCGASKVGAAHPDNNSRWKAWLCLQGCIAALLLPLYPQLWRIIQARQSLNWERKYPGAGDFFMFLDLRPLVWGVAAWLVLRAVQYCVVPAPRVIHPIERRSDRHAWVLLSLWYLVPLGLYFGLARGNGLNLFVERYLILASLPLFLGLPVIAFKAGPKWAARGALLTYMLVYLYTTPVAYFRQRGQFSQGVPGGNEWREALGQLAETKFQSSLLLFQSPFIESNQLNFADEPYLSRYLSAPLHSFYVRRPVEPFVLLPVHWWIDNPTHQLFKSQLQRRLQSCEDFTLLATQEFFDYFEPWLKKAATDVQWQVMASFRSSGALRVRRWVRTPHRRPVL